MNLNKIRHLVVIKAGADNINLTVEDFPLIDEMVNEAQRQFARDSLYLQKTATVSADGSSMYKLPDGFIKLRTALYNSVVAEPVDSINLASVIASGTASESVSWVEV